MSSARLIDDLTDKLADAKVAYLKAHGWRQTSNTPGSYWLWRRDFAGLDAMLLDAWETRPPGPLGKPSRPQPYGIITSPTDLAVAMTQAVNNLYGDRLAVLAAKVPA